MTAPGATTARALLMLPTADGVPVTDPRVPARQAAEDELSKPRYQEHEPNIVQRVFDAVWDWISDVLDAASGAAPGGGTGLAVIVLIVLLLGIALRLRLGPPRPAAKAEPGALFEERTLSSAEHRAAAEEHAAHHRWSDAVQERMRAIVRSLEERTLIDVRPGRTAAETAAEAGLAIPTEAGRLAAAARTFDGIRYGGRPGSEHSYAQLSELDRDLRRTPPLLPSDATGGR